MTHYSSESYVSSISSDSSDISDDELVYTPSNSRILWRTPATGERMTERLSRPFFTRRRIDPKEDTVSFLEDQLREKEEHYRRWYQMNRDMEDDVLDQRHELFDLTAETLFWKEKMRRCLLAQELMENYIEGQLSKKASKNPPRLISYASTRAILRGAYEDYKKNTDDIQNPYHRGEVQSTRTNGIPEQRPELELEPSSFPIPEDQSLDEKFEYLLIEMRKYEIHTQLLEQRLHSLEAERGIIYSQMRSVRMELRRRKRKARNQVRATKVLVKNIRSGLKSAVFQGEKRKIYLNEALAVVRISFTQFHTEMSA